MNLCLFVLAAWLTDQPPVLRVIYDLEITHGNNQVTARLVIHQLDAARFSIHCARGTSGTLFTYWATPEDNTLYLPKEDLVFVGAAEERFGLFPNGPELDRTTWLNLLWGTPPAVLGDFSVADEAGWRLLRRREPALTIRWREKKRGERTHYAARTLTPEVGEDVVREALNRMPLYWVEE